MFNIYTSYWAMVRSFPPNLVGLNTTIFPPRWRKLGQDKNGVWIIDCPPLKPGPSCNNLCHGDCDPKSPDNCAFLREYRKQLDAIDFAAFYSNLERLSVEFKEKDGLDVDFAYIVFETPQNPCSERWALQAWSAVNGLEIREWQK